MSARATKFESYAAHPWLKRVYAKLSEADRAEAHELVIGMNIIVAGVRTDLVDRDDANVFGADFHEGSLK